ncbi:MAG: carbohydrate kinase family protein [Erythrobacter sp.]|nr:carbohydrate kinase family protein [Erythrobacter sp.]
MNTSSVAVIGPIPRDRIITHRGETVEKYGCAIYTAAALASLGREELDVRLVSHVRKADRAGVESIFDSYSNVDTTPITDASDKGDVITLTYLDQNRREETQTGFMDPILPVDIDPLLDSEAFVFVPITDFEVPLETLKHIKAHSDAPIIFDAHGPTVCCSKFGKRHHKFWVDRDRWMPFIDLLKMNLEEARCCWFDEEVELDELAENAELSRGQLPAFALDCLNKGVKAVYVTLDEEGCAVFYKDAGGEMVETIVPRIVIEDVVDTTGCGDSFAGGLAFGYLRTGDFVKAAQFGNYAGAMRCTSIELDIYGTIQEAEARLSETYG